MARRLSIHRATTVSPKSSLCQVILKNTCVVKDPPHSAANASMNRSQSLLTTHQRIPILAPSRAERARLEALLADVWSRDILPFPGMTTRSRSEHLVRTSASSMMRRLSVASITGSFGRRPGSLTSLPKASADTETGEGDDGSWNASHQDPDTPIEWKSPFGEESGLPMIQDENEARTPDCADTPPSPRSITHAGSAEGLYMGTIRRRSPGPPMAVIQTRRDLDAQDTTRVSTLTRPRTEPSGIQPSGQGLHSTPVSSEKENLQPEKSLRDSRRRRSKRWDKVSKATTLGKGSVLSGLRSIFT